MDLTELKANWNQVLDELERANRVSWLIFFDARLVSLEGNKLTIDFLDRTKLAANHDFASHISQPQLQALTTAIQTTLGIHLAVLVKS
jgi:hypothetical protein